MRTVLIGENRRRVAIAFATAGLLGIASGTPAVADRTVVADGAATPGPLDIKSVWHAHGPKLRLVHGIRTYKPWRSRILRFEKNWLALTFDSADGYPRGNRFLWIKYSRRRDLTATMYRPGEHPNEKFIGEARVWRPNRRTVKVSFPRRFLRRRQIDRYWWSAMSSYEDPNSESCPETPRLDFPFGSCSDNVPNGERSIRHHL